MSAGRLALPWRAMLVLISACGAVLLHLAIVGRFGAALGAALSLAPAALAVAWATRRSRHRGWLLAALALAMLAVYANWDALERHFPSVFYVEHACANLALAIVFGRTLAAGREPLCTRFARILHDGVLPAHVGEYTRHVTAAWTLFFAAMAALSTLLYFGGWLEAWSLFATMASPVLVALMFGVEYLVRMRTFPDLERVGVLGGIRAFSRHFAAASADSR